MSEEREIECCPNPDCRSARFNVFPGDVHHKPREERYRCKDCERWFKEPDTKTTYQTSGATVGLARKLEDPNVTDIGVNDGD